jgi:hypothetical protein
MIAVRRDFNCVKVAVTGYCGVGWHHRRSLKYVQITLKIRHYDPLKSLEQIQRRSVISQEDFNVMRFIYGKESCSIMQNASVLRSGQFEGCCWSLYVLFWCDAEVVQLSSEWHTLLGRQSVYIMAYGVAPTSRRRELLLINLSPFKCKIRPPPRCMSIGRAAQRPLHIVVVTPCLPKDSLAAMFLERIEIASITLTLLLLKM